MNQQIDIFEQEEYHRTGAISDQGGNFGVRRVTMPIVHNGEIVAPAYMSVYGNVLTRAALPRRS